MAGRARDTRARLDGSTLRRAASAAVARGAREGSGRSRHGEADACLVGRRRRAAGAVPRAPVGGRRANRARVPLHACDQRVLGAPRPDVGCAARSRPRGRGCLSRANRVPGTGIGVRGRASRGRRRPGDRGARRLRRDRRASRHRRRSLASVPAAASALGSRHPQSGQRRDRSAASDDPRPARAPCDRARGDHRRDGRPRWSARDRSGRVDPADPRGGLAAELRRRIQRVLADRSDPRGARGSRRSERRRRRARRGADRAHRDGGAVCRVRRRPAATRHRGRGRPRHADDRPSGERRQCRPGLREHRRAGRCAGRSDSRRLRWTPCRADRPRPRSRRPEGALRRGRPARRSADGHGDSRRRSRRSTDGGSRASAVSSPRAGRAPSPGVQFFSRVLRCPTTPSRR